jgi:hypothetical protein
MTSYYIQDPLWAMLAMGLASFSNDLVMPGAWSTCMDVGGRYAGTVSGSMNMMGNLGGVFGPIVIGHNPAGNRTGLAPIFRGVLRDLFPGRGFAGPSSTVTPFDKPAKA